jgi:hypothetical protein
MNINIISIIISVAINDGYENNGVINVSANQSINQSGGENINGGRK